jgi:two-component system, chemotaxis family, chemotaxis protein CheY
VKKTVLIVDDSSTARKINEQCFLQAYKKEASILFAENGLVAIDLLRENKVDLILSDIIMPEMEGTELLEYIRDISVLSKIPCVMITSMSEEHLIKALLEKGANDIIKKPISSEKLENTLNKIGFE